MFCTERSLRKADDYSIYKRVRRYRTELIKFIEPRFGLVEELVSLSFLIQSKPTTTEQSKQILDFVLKKPSKETQTFLRAFIIQRLPTACS